MAICHPERSEGSAAWLEVTGPAAEQLRLTTPMSVSIWRICPTEIESVLPSLADLLRETVNGGAPLGFLPPLTLDDARAYWMSIRPAMYAGTRVLLAAFADGEIVGSGQLTFASAPNARHRGEVQKVFVGTAWRGQGVGESLMRALHRRARLHGRHLLLLNTRHRGRAEAFYKRLGYREVGVVPGYSVGPAGERFDSVTLYRELT